MKTFEISNLKCGGCVNTVKKGILSIDNIDQVEVDLETSKVTIETDNEELINRVKVKLSKMGYPEVGDLNNITHKVKSFVSCASGRMASKVN